MKKELTRKQRKEYFTRKKIINAAKKLFQEKGYKKTSVDEIADNSILSKGTFYHYFKSKENLFISAMKETEVEVFELLDEIVSTASTKDSKEILKNLIAGMLDYFEKDLYLVHLAFYRDAEFNNEIIEYLREFQICLKDKMVFIFNRLRLLEQQRSNHFALTFMGALYTHISYWFFNSNGMKLSLKDSANSLFEQFYPYLRNYS